MKPTPIGNEVNNFIMIELEKGRKLDLTYVIAFGGLNMKSCAPLSVI